MVKDDLPSIYDKKTRELRQELLSEYNFARHHSEKLAKMVMDNIHKEKK